MDDVSSYKQLAGNVFLYGSVSLALSMARETKMIQCLCGAGVPLTSSQVAQQLQLKERYVREILNSLTVGGLVQLETGTGGREGPEARYWVPHTCRQVLLSTSAANLFNLYAARRFRHTQDCFKLDGPNGFRLDASFFETHEECQIGLIKPTVEAILKTQGLTEQLETGIKAIEVGSGTGKLFLRLAAMFPNSHFTLTDCVSDPLERARKQASDEGLTNVSFQVLDVLQVPDHLKETADWVVSEKVIHDLPYPFKGLQGIFELLKPGCHYSLIDQCVSSYIAENLTCQHTAVLYSLSTFSCIPESYQDAGSEALGPCWGTDKAHELVHKAGFKVLGVTRSDELGTTGVYMCQKPAKE